jgi:formiminotetrahydrofolate cyclodeaminase
MLVEQSVKTFIDILASDTPAPGGGSISALNGSLAAGLIAMVCQLSLTQKTLADYVTEIKKAQDHAFFLKNKLGDLIDEDTLAFNRVMMAYQLPKTTPEQSEKRSTAIQSAFKEAVNVPLLIAEKSSEVLDLAVIMARHFNKNTASDLGVGAYCAVVGVKGALMNVDINLPSIKDSVFVDGIQTMKKKIIKTIDQRLNDVLLAVNNHIT